MLVILFFCFLFFFFFLFFCVYFFFFLMIRRPPRSTLDRSSAASDVYKRQGVLLHVLGGHAYSDVFYYRNMGRQTANLCDNQIRFIHRFWVTFDACCSDSVSYTHLRAHETVLDIVCRLLLEKKTKKKT